jgi:hypothetical protein
LILNHNPLDLIEANLIAPGDLNGGDRRSAGARAPA